MSDKNASTFPPTGTDGNPLKPVSVRDTAFEITGNLYQATAQALSNAAHNATVDQQNAFVLAQAATTAGVAMLYALDTASQGVAAENMFKSEPLLADALKTLTSVEPQPETGLQDKELVDGFARYAADAVNDIESIMEAFATSLDRLGESAHRRLLRIVKLSATAACLAEMIKSPEKVEQYERVLALIKSV